MDIENRKLDTLTPYENNPRVNDGAVAAVVASIREFGFRVPLVIDEQGNIVAGHTRYKAAKKMGLDEVPCCVVTDLTPDQLRAYRIADNKTAEIAEWDIERLSMELTQLAEADFDMSTIGFSEDEINELVDGGTDGLTDADAVPEPPEKPITQPGDLWLMGDHRLLCGDSTKAEDVARVMDGAKADMLLTDPPYNVAYEGGTKPRNAIQGDCMTDSDFRDFIASACKAAFDAMKPGASFYIWHADSEGYNFRGAIRDCKQQVRQCLVWCKNNSAFCRQDYHWQHEPCLYGWKDGAAHGWYSDRKQTTILNFDRPARSDEHPTMKPVPLFSYLIGNSTAPQGLVYDPFCGSGTTIIAAEQLGRRCYAIEIDPTYCDVAVKRWEEFTGKTAERQERT